ncbi:hypothetical protein XCR_0092 [Xanthomonas campestris pv. raphani 756C]|nr:hypothetical protein XCR_0092 [Xanthomonas campestris pv. raphani 756C]
MCAAHRLRRDHCSAVSHGSRAHGAPQCAGYARALIDAWEGIA